MPLRLGSIDGGFWNTDAYPVCDLLSTVSEDAVVRDMRQGPFWTAILTRSCGLASTPHEQGFHPGHVGVADAGKLKNGRKDNSNLQE